METKILQLRFINANGGRVTISLNDPLDDLTEEQVSEAMDDIIDKNIFITSGGDLVGKHSAQIIERTTTVVYEA